MRPVYSTETDSKPARRATRLCSIDEPVSSPEENINYALTNSNKENMAPSVVQSNPLSITTEVSVIAQKNGKNVVNEQNVSFNLIERIASYEEPASSSLTDISSATAFPVEIASAGAEQLDEIESVAAVISPTTSNAFPVEISSAGAEQLDEIESVTAVNSPTTPNEEQNEKNSVNEQTATVCSNNFDDKKIVDGKDELFVASSSATCSSTASTDQQTPKNVVNTQVAAEKSALSEANDGFNSNVKQFPKGPPKKRLKCSVSIDRRPKLRLIPQNKQNVPSDVESRVTSRISVPVPRFNYGFSKTSQSFYQDVAIEHSKGNIACSFECLKKQP